MSQQAARQASVRAVTGTALTYEGDWHALFDAASVPAAVAQIDAVAAQIADATGSPEHLIWFAIRAYVERAWEAVRQEAGAVAEYGSPACAMEANGFAVDVVGVGLLHISRDGVDVQGAELRATLVDSEARADLFADDLNYQRPLPSPTLSDERGCWPMLFAPPGLYRLTVSYEGREVMSMHSQNPSG